jgi:hypothetical protein
VIYVSKRGPIALLAGVLAAVLILAGCGGGGSSDSTNASSDSNTAALSKAEFIKKADAICTAGGKRTQEEFASYIKEKKLTGKKEPTPAQLTEVSEEIQVPALKRQAEEISALGAPAGDEDQINELVDAIDEGIENVEAADPKEALASLSTMFAEADKLAAAYGLKVCGQGEG